MLAISPNRCFSMQHITSDGLAPSTEQSLLMRELEATYGVLDLNIGTMELILGVPAGTLTSAISRTLPRAAERQVRRLVEVASTARLLLGSENVGCWLHTPLPGLGHRTPSSIMRQPGGLAYLRDLLRQALEELVEVPS
jgi:hypothetical protein